MALLKNTIHCQLAVNDVNKKTEYIVSWLLMTLLKNRTHRQQAVNDVNKKQNTLSAGF